jgi:hypothetical protein
MGTSKPTAASLVEEKLKLKTEAEGILQNFLAALGV